MSKALLSSFFLIFALSAQANIFFSDDRKSITPEQESPLAKIGVLRRSADNTQRGTAFLIHRCYALTNLHVASKNPEEPGNERLIFIIPYSFMSVGELVLHGNYNLVSAHPNMEDWALIRLKPCADHLKSFFILDPTNMKNLSEQKIELAMAGFPEDKSLEFITLDPSCLIRDEDGRHDCATRTGNSGSPIFYKNLPQHVVALTTSTRGDFPEIIKSYDVTMSNGSTPVSQFENKIKNYLKKK